MEPTLFGVELFRVVVPLLDNPRIQIDMDFIEYSLINIPARTFQGECFKATKANWLKEGF